MIVNCRKKKSLKSPVLRLIYYPRSSPTRPKKFHKKKNAIQLFLFKTRPPTRFTMAFWEPVCIPVNSDFYEHTIIVWSQFVDVGPVILFCQWAGHPPHVIACSVSSGIIICRNHCRVKIFHYDSLYSLQDTTTPVAIHIF